MNFLESIIVNVPLDRVNPDNIPDGYGSSGIEIDPFVRGVICGAFFAILFGLIIIGIVMLVKGLKANKETEEENEFVCNCDNDVKEEQFDEYENLKKYKMLFDNGLITQEDYEKKKKQILRL